MASLSVNTGILIPFIPFSMMHFPKRCFPMENFCCVVFGPVLIFCELFPWCFSSVVQDVLPSAGKLTIIDACCTINSCMHKKFIGGNKVLCWIFNLLFLSIDSPLVRQCLSSSLSSFTWYLVHTKNVSELFSSGSRPGASSPIGTVPLYPRRTWWCWWCGRGDCFHHHR